MKSPDRRRKVQLLLLLWYARRPTSWGTNSVEDEERFRDALAINPPFHGILPHWRASGPSSPRVHFERHGEYQSVREESERLRNNFHGGILGPRRRLEIHALRLTAQHGTQHIS